jgi:hypothetical protein
VSQGQQVTQAQLVQLVQEVLQELLAPPVLQAPSETPVELAQEVQRVQQALLDLQVQREPRAAQAPLVPLEQLEQMAASALAARRDPWGLRVLSEERLRSTYNLMSRLSQGRPQDSSA